MRMSASHFCVISNLHHCGLFHSLAKMNESSSLQQEAWLAPFVATTDLLWSEVVASPRRDNPEITLFGKDVAVFFFGFSPHVLLTCLPSSPESGS